MTQATFRIQDVELTCEIDRTSNPKLHIASSPRPYAVNIQHSLDPMRSLTEAIKNAAHPLLLIDKNISLRYPSADLAALNVPTVQVEAREENKNIDEVLSVIDFLEKNGATRQSTLFVVGGGIIQDLGAFAAYLYKRGIPWRFYPTTLLAQGDSCVGGKTAINHRSTKNLLALFSAPRSVEIDTGFLTTLDPDDLLSGFGEVFRLHVTGGTETLDSFEQLWPAHVAGSEDAIQDLIYGALAVKQAVVEHDEFEIDIRRSMNYGHSFGHALEALVDFRVPHGVAVTVGALVENEISNARGLLSDGERDRMIRLAAPLIPPAARAELQSLNLDGVLDLFRRDKKTEGSVLKLAVVESVGQIRFIDFPLDQSSTDLLARSIEAVLERI